jgi:hypothetical protein
MLLRFQPGEIRRWPRDMTRSRDDVLASVRAAFREGSWPRVLDLLDTFGVESRERERERVQLAILELSQGSEERLREYVAAAKRDYRDVLYWAEYPEDSRIDTPEKLQRVRELFEKLGIGGGGMARPVDDYRPLLREAIAEARAAGLGHLADPLEETSLAAYTTSSELMGETGRAIVGFLRAGGDTVPAEVATKLTACLRHIRTVWPDIRP